MVGQHKSTISLYSITRQTSKSMSTISLWLNDIHLKDTILQHKEIPIKEKGAMPEQVQRKSKRYDTQNKIQHDVCPRYGVYLLNDIANMVFFDGCSNYPKHTFTLNK